MEIQNNYFQEIINMNDLSGVYFDGDDWWAYVTISGIKYNIYKAFETKEEAEESLHQYLKETNQWNLGTIKNL